MSTRCQIGIYSNEEDKMKDHVALLYQHFDGYEEGVIPIILPICKDFIYNRRYNEEYLGARLIAAMCGDEIGYIGYGICNEFHNDIEYFYKIHPKGINVYSCKWDENPEDYKLIKTILF